MKSGQIMEVLVELAPRLDLEEIVEEPDARSCTLVGRNDTLIIVDHEVDRKRLLLSAPVAEFPEAGADRIASRLLEFNYDVLAGKGPG